MKILKSLKDVPVVGKVVRGVVKMKAAKELDSIASHFSRYLYPVVIPQGKNAADSFKIRHKVYCEELRFEPLKEDGIETDEFDRQSLHCLIQHRPTATYAGTVRLIMSAKEDEKLPIELYCSEAITRPDLFPSNFDRDDICEISRLAVPAEFRRRKMDQYEGAATGIINEYTYSETELRCFPFIAVGLYLSATAVLVEKGIHHCYVMVEPRLARSMRMVGLQFEQIGPVVDYHGRRAPFYIRPLDVPGALKDGFKQLLNNIDAEIKNQRLD